MSLSHPSRIPKSFTLFMDSSLDFDDLLLGHFCQSFVRGKRGRSTRLELATFGTTIQRSNQLSYDRHITNGYQTK